MVVAALLSAALLAGDTTPSHSLGIILDFPGEHSEPLIKTMQRELVGIIDIPGVHIHFRSYAEYDDEAFDRVIVVRMLGGCIAAPAYQSVSSGLPLGRTHVSEGIVLPLIDIQCDRVRALLTFSGPGAISTSNVRITGRALGRVLAHEVYHVLSGSLSHAEYGVAMASLSAKDLICDDLPLSEGCLSSVRRAFARPTTDMAD